MPQGSVQWNSCPFRAEEGHDNKLTSGAKWVELDLIKARTEPTTAGKEKRLVFEFLATSSLQGRLPSNEGW